MLEVMSTSVYTGLNLLNFIRKHFLQICVRKAAVHVSKVLDVMSTSVYTGLNPFNFIRKHFLQICVRKVAVLVSKVLEVMSMNVCTGLNPFNFIRKSGGVRSGERGGHKTKDVFNKKNTFLN
jgi:hypothetical protein